MLESVTTTPSSERRSERARQAILHAAFELCRENGFAATTMEGIAKRAGVGKQTIYRWWPSKAAVLHEALNEMGGAATGFPDTGDVYADLHGQMTRVVQLLTTDGFHDVYAGMIAATQSDEAVSQSFLETMIRPRVDACRARLEKAREQGQIRADADLDDVVELIYAPIYYRLLLRTRPLSTDQVTAILDLAFTGLTPTTPMPFIGRKR
jgi:AcrR family transcriptional regulator